MSYDFKSSPWTVEPTSFKNGVYVKDNRLPIDCQLPLQLVSEVISASYYSSNVEFLHMILTFPENGMNNFCVFKWLWTFAESGLNKRSYTHLEALLNEYTDPTSLRNAFTKMFGYNPLPLIVFRGLNSSHIAFSHGLTYEWNSITSKVGSDEEMTLYAMKHSNLRRFSPLKLSYVERQRLANYCIDNNLMAHEIPHSMPLDYPISDTGLCLNVAISHIHHFKGINLPVHQLPFTYNLMDLLPLFGRDDTLPLRFTRVTPIFYHVDFDEEATISKAELCLMANMLGPIWYGSQQVTIARAVSNEISPSLYFTNLRSMARPRYHPAENKADQFKRTGYLTTRKYTIQSCLHDLLPALFTEKRTYSCKEAYNVMTENHYAFIFAQVSFYNSVTLHLEPSEERLPVDFFLGLDL